ncbi:MAG: phosphoribosylaminoimidazolesuccinocarboxamide synthase [Ignavibacteriales bacterium CG12_big_fil_rev_8_21_14_0_65_30_8]|nr:MAG: phosphoribosylaminoimidazolesuccinocarboxamide synthase [Ignavibacteriales bacterium CG12_big_fil_rev_8_21_14_0_65_30_8]
MNGKVMLQTKFPNLKLAKQGKVRDIYDLGEHFLIVSTDRLSAFDVIMDQGIPFKGKVLTKISEFWFDFNKDIIENHLISTNVDDFPSECQEYKEDLKGRSMLVKKAEVVPLECIVRGYISGSGWNDYKKTGEISGIKLPEGLFESDKFPEPIFTPSTKAEIGLHDENISEKDAEKFISKEIIEQLGEKSISIYKNAADFALTKGIIIADTKFEYGLYNGKLILIDEALTPDSSRFWPKDLYEPGGAQQSYDKQFVRDYLLSINFNKQPPPPTLPDEIVNNTSKKYLDVLNKLTGENLS